MLSLKLALRMRLVRSTENVSRSANRADHFAIESAIYFASNATDECLHNAAARIEMDIPNMLQQHGLGHDPIGVSHEVFNQPELTGMKLYRLPAACHGSL